VEGADEEREHEGRLQDEGRQPAIHALDVRAAGQAAGAMRPPPTTASSASSAA
jgi:hypothetical protein